MSLQNLWNTLTGRGDEKIKAEERRSETRLPVHGPVVVRREVEGAEGEAVGLVGISERGFSFRAASEFPPEQRILVENSEEQFEAVVRHCQAEGDGFIVGAEIPSRDSRPLEAQEATTGSD
jgi:hypothetical protein